MYRLGKGERLPFKEPPIHPIKTPRSSSAEKLFSPCLGGQMGQLGGPWGNIPGEKCGDSGKSRKPTRTNNCFNLLSQKKTSILLKKGELRAVSVSFQETNQDCFRFLSQRRFIRSCFSWRPVASGPTSAPPEMPRPTAAWHSFRRLDPAQRSLPMECRN